MKTLSEKFSEKWFKSYFFDVFWRKLYGVRFGSEEHLNKSIIDMAIELREEAELLRMQKRLKDGFDDKDLKDSVKAIEDYFLKK